MALETFIGPDAADFATSTNYAGQYLAPGQNHLYSLSFTPQSLGFESAALTNYGKFVAPKPVAPDSQSRFTPALEKM